MDSYCCARHNRPIARLVRYSRVLDEETNCIRRGNDETGDSIREELPCCFGVARLGTSAGHFQGWTLFGVMQLQGFDFDSSKATA